MPGKAVIETLNLTKVYPGGGGCRDITLEVAEGEVFGLLGPNGAGKSTFVKLLTGLIFPTSGQARLLGRPLGEVAARREIGFLPENFRYHDWLPAGELLALHATLHGVPPQEACRRIPEVLAGVKLSGVENKRVRTFSKGMQQRLGLAIALLARPRLLFLDEPTSALDPLGRREIREVIQHLASQGVTVFLNSHLLSEVERVCTRVAFIKEGVLVATGKLDALLAPGLEVRLRLGNLSQELLDQLAQMGSGLQVEGDLVTLQVPGPEDIPALAAVVVRTGGRLYSLEPRRGTLEDLFVEIIADQPPNGKPADLPAGNQEPTGGDGRARLT